VHTNRLIHETSPYLLQHAHNPVDWYSWGPDAFDAARTQNKPIFLSVGYSTCYWCHVMERESFEQEAVAQVMNEHCINIKVDREERPDVDQLYMLAVQVLTRHGGWPMSVFLTPDLKPFYGGTYFPPQDMQGRPGFVTVVRAIDQAFRQKRADVERSADELLNILRQISEPATLDAPITIDDAFIDRCAARSIDDYEPTHGGFGGAPKFPRETLLELLLTYTAGEKGDAALKQRVLAKVTHTLDAMAAGGIRDQLGGGFHRYSTDAQWLVPHFEIMLYDNATLAWCYAEAYRQTKEQRHATVARGILDFVLREMTAPSGAFYTAFDAEVDAMEGASYLWTADEVRAILGEEDGILVNKIYGLDQGPNFADPHHGTGAPDKNVLFVADSKLKETHEQRLAPLRQKLYEARRKRKQPGLDTKIITSWNALMIRAFAYAGQILREQRYIEAAAKAATFLLQNHRTEDRGLIRTSRQMDVAQPPPAVSSRKIAGFIDDYAFLAQALIALGDATAKSTWKDHAKVIATMMLKKFGDPNRGGFFFSEESAQDLIIRQKTASDSPLPSGNATAAIAMLELNQPELTRNVLKVFARQLRDQTEGVSALVEAAALYVRQHGALAVEAQPQPERPPSPGEIAKQVVRIGGGFSGPRELHIVLSILEPFHINAAETGDVLIPTSIGAPVEQTPQIESVDFPPGEEERFAFTRSPLHVYRGNVRIVVRFKDDVGAKPLRLQLKYQACDDNACLPPVTQEWEVKRGG